MTIAFRHRLIVLLAAVGIVAALTVWGVVYSGRRIVDLEHTLTAGHLESFRVADDFQQRLLELNNSMLRYTVRRDPAIWSEFERASARLDNWTDENDPRINRQSRLTTQREREIFKQMNDAYDGYLAAARQVHTNAQPAATDATGTSPLSQFERQAERLLQLGLQLGDAHRAAEDAFLGQANRSLSKLRALLIGGMVFMLALMAALGLLLYRDMIAPMRTKLVQSEAILERQEKLATLGTLAAGIAHEIRNPLTSVKARLYTLQKHLESPQLARKDAEIISAEIGRLERIVQEVLLFARPSEPEFQQVSADLLLQEVQRLLGPSLEKGRVQVVVEPAPLLMLSIDSALLKQVVINLVRNASEAIDGSGKITLRARADRARLKGELRPVVILEVEDTGKGIPPDVEKRLFDPFFTTKDAGTGLGLSIAARIVEKHNGLLQYRTSVGVGTTFGIMLPLDTAG